MTRWGRRPGDWNPPQGTGRGRGHRQSQVPGREGSAGSGVGLRSYLTLHLPLSRAQRPTTSSPPHTPSPLSGSPASQVSQSRGRMTAPSGRRQWTRRDLVSPASQLLSQSRNLPCSTTFRGSLSQRSGEGPRGPGHALRPAQGGPGSQKPQAHRLEGAQTGRAKTPAGSASPPEQYHK